MKSLPYVESNASLTPKDFIMLCSPSWARVYIELAYGRDPSMDRLAYNGDSVRREYISLTGFDPAKVQFAEYDIQHEALNVARELDSALYNADESAQLDGHGALQYASGWIACYVWLNDSDSSYEPNEQEIDNAARKFSLVSKNKEYFMLGFKSRCKLNPTFVA